LSPHLRQCLMRWSDHVDSWLSAPFPVRLLRYEDMHADPRAAFGAAAAFLGLLCDRETIDAAVAATTFSRLQAQERESGFIEKPRTAGALFRDWRVDRSPRVLTPDQAGRIV